MRRRPYVQIADFGLMLAPLFSVQAVAQEEQDRQVFYEKHRAYIRPFLAAVYAFDFSP